MGFNIKNNYGPNIEVNDGGKVTLVQGKSGLWQTVDAEEAEYEEVAGDETLLTKLSLCFKDEDTARRFLTSIKELDDTETVRLAKKYSDSGLCTDTSKALWKLFSDAGLYKTGYPNWNKQMNQR